MKTIAAIATAYGTGGIAVVRVSGDEAIAVVERVVGRPLTRRVQYISVSDLDDTVVTVYHAPHSYTGEEVVEVSCHGSLYIQQELLRRLIDAGCRMARPGEYTQRAFLNGKMDLTQAEAVADLIAAETQAEQQMALSQLRGSVSDELSTLRERLLRLTSLMELELDFADHEELEFADRSELQALSREIGERLKTLTDSFSTGNAVKNGIPVAIVGPTNVGKSTLLNALLGEERAIVSDIHGTTRDTIEERLVLNGQLFRLIDTAGLRDTQDPIEALGIARSRQAMEKAGIVVMVDEARGERLEARGENRVIRVHNKADLIRGAWPKNTNNELWLSAKQGDADCLKQALIRYAATLAHPDGAVVSNARHYHALVKALEAIERVQQGLNEGLSGELIVMDLQDCLHALGEVTGEISSEEVLGNIFRHFCIGK